MTTKNSSKKNNVNVFSPDLIKTLPHETPFFLFSKKKMLENIQEFRELFPGSIIQYAMKANSEPEVLETIAGAGVGFEVASKFELEMLKALSVPAEKIIYGSSVKAAAHIKEFFEYGVDRFAADSFHEIEKIAAIAPGSKVYIRTTANDSGSVYKFSEKFGADPTNIIPLLTKVKELGLSPYGISFHVGSQASDPKAWANVLIMLRSIISDLREEGITLEVLDIGGGYPCRYASSEEAPRLREISSLIYEQYNKLPYKPQLILEPGRGMVATTGVLVASVIARINRGGNTWLFLDAGVYNGLFEAMSYQGSVRYSVTSMRPVGNAGEAMFELAGPTGDSPDVISREALLPQDIDVGDKLIFHNTGAYNLFFVSTFNGFPKPAVYYF